MKRMIDLVKNKVEMLEGGSFKYTGIVDETIHLVQEKQLKDANYWKLFVEQYRKGNVDDHDRGWRGEYWGKMMRGASLTYLYTQDEELYNLLEASVYDLLTTQDELNRFSTYSIECEFSEWDMWSRKYILLGSMYFLDICKYEELKNKLVNALVRHADYIISKVGDEEQGKIPVTKTSIFWNGLNSSSILEPFVRLYVLTGFERYLDFVRHIIKCGGTDGFNVFEAAYENKLYPYEYPVTKAYEMMSCFEGLLWFYRVTREEKYLSAAKNFANKVIESDITVIGSAGCTHELFDNSIINQFDPAYDGIMQETCVTVTWLKFLYQLLQITGDKSYADHIEVSIYNALLGSINTEGNERINTTPVFDSYSPLRKASRGRATGGLKDIAPDTYYGCCIAIGAAGTALSALSSVGRTEKGFQFNLYYNGIIKTKTPKGNNIEFGINTTYPVGEDIDININLDREEELTLDFRLPFGGKLYVNDNEIDTDTVTRVWKAGDKACIKTNLKIRLLKDTDILPEAAERKERYGVLLRGPIVLARDARISNDLDTPLAFQTDNEGYVTSKFLETKAPFRTLLAYELELEGGKYTFVDYAHAGRIWDENLPMAAWIIINDKI